MEATASNILLGILLAVGVCCAFVGAILTLILLFKHIGLIKKPTTVKHQVSRKQSVLTVVFTAVASLLIAYGVIASLAIQDALGLIFIIPGIVILVFVYGRNQNKK